jgi:hypothetical protein
MYESVPCPNRCSASLLRFNVDDHIEYLCPKRRVVCDFCSQEFPGDYMDTVREREREGERERSKPQCSVRNRKREREREIKTTV